MLPLTEPIRALWHKLGQEGKGLSTWPKQPRNAKHKTSCVGLTDRHLNSNSTSLTRHPSSSVLALGPRLACVPPYKRVSAQDVRTGNHTSELTALVGRCVQSGGSREEEGALTVCARASHQQDVRFGPVDRVMDPSSRLLDTNGTPLCVRAPTPHPRRLSTQLLWAKQTYHQFSNHAI
jgi:hypothetical protein